MLVILRVCGFLTYAAKHARPLTTYVLAQCHIIIKLVRLIHPGVSAIDSVPRFQLRHDRVALYILSYYTEHSTSPGMSSKEAYLNTRVAERSPWTLLKLMRFSA